jgi:hypothetical protein
MIRGRGKGDLWLVEYDDEDKDDDEDKKHDKDKEDDNDDKEE